MEIVRLSPIILFFTASAYLFCDFVPTFITPAARGGSSGIMTHVSWLAADIAPRTIPVGKILPLEDLPILVVPEVAIAIPQVHIDRLRLDFIFDAHLAARIRPKPRVRDAVDGTGIRAGRRKGGPGNPFKLLLSYVDG